MSGHWYYVRQGQRHGPFSLEQFTQMTADRQVHPHDMVMNDADRQWRSLKDVAGLACVESAKSPTGTNCNARTSGGPPVGNSPACSAIPIVAQSSQDKVPRYALLLVILMPLAGLCLKATEDDRFNRFDRTMQRASPDVQARIQAVVNEVQQGNASWDAVFAMVPELPEKRIDGAHLPSDSIMHWLYAGFAVAAYFGVLCWFFPTKTVPPWEVVLVGLFTATIGILMLFLVQYVAEAVASTEWKNMPHNRGAGIVGILKLIGWSYRSAYDPNCGLVLSFLGFTCGVGLCEELSKIWPVAYRRRVLLNWQDAGRWGLASGIGFGIAEALMYAGIYNGVEHWDMYLVRFVSCVALHGIWTSSAALSLYRNRDWLANQADWLAYMLVLAWLILVPIALHGLYDTVLKKELNPAALLVALASVGWLEWQIQRFRQQDMAPAPAVTTAVS